MLAKLIRRFLSLLFKFKVYSKHYKIVYGGEITSANKIWSAQHWSVRSGIKSKYREIFTVLLLEAKVKKLSEFTIVVFYNTKHDVDNLFAVSKILADTMKEQYIDDDDTRYYKSYHSINDKNLPKGTVEFHIYGN